MDVIIGAASSAVSLNVIDRVVCAGVVNPDKLDYGEEVQRVKAKNPDAIVLIGFRESALILREMIDQGLGPRDKRVYGADANVDGTLAPEVNRQDPGVLDGMKGTTLRPGPNDPFIVRAKEFDPTLQDLAYAPQAYDAVVVTALAAAVAGTDAPAAVAAEINGVTRNGVKCADFAACMALVGRGENIDYDGASGPLEFADPGESSVGLYVISEIQADGSLEPLRTVEVGSAT